MIWVCQWRDTDQDSVSLTRSGRGQLWFPPGYLGWEGVGPLRPQVRIQLLNQPVADEPGGEWMGKPCSL